MKGRLLLWVGLLATGVVLSIREPSLSFEKLLQLVVGVTAIVWGLSIMIDDLKKDFEDSLLEDAPEDEEEEEDDQ